VKDLPRPVVIGSNRESTREPSHIPKEDGLLAKDLVGRILGRRTIVRSTAPPFGSESCSSDRDRRESVERYAIILATRSVAGNRPSIEPSPHREPSTHQVIKPATWIVLLPTNTGASGHAPHLSSARAFSYARWLYFIVVLDKTDMSRPFKKPLSGS
jgi:hypothetical protein